MFQTAKSVVKTKPNIIDEYCTRNDDGVPAVIDEKIKLNWKSYHEKLLNTMFAWDESSLSPLFGNIACLVDVSLRPV